MIIRASEPPMKERRFLVEALSTYPISCFLSIQMIFAKQM